MRPVIKKQFTWKGILITWFVIGWIGPLLLVGGILMLFRLPDSEITPIMLMTLFVTTVIVMPAGVIFAALTRVRPEKRYAEVQQAAARYGYRVTSGSGITTGSIYSQLMRSAGDPPADIDIMDAVEGSGWRYGEYRVTAYAELRSDNSLRYKSSYRYTAVVAVQLPRMLPNLFFDSHVAHGDAMRFRLDGSQRLSLEGNFDKYFTLYAPLHYSIDTLSFITPEVMESMIAAGDYDIEIAENMLYIYGEGIERDPAAFVSMAQKAVQIYDKLMNNIVTYRDERLPDEQGRRTVSAFAWTLRKSLLGNWAFTIGMFSITVFYLVMSLSRLDGDAIFTLVLMASTFGWAVWCLASEYKDRREAEEAYQRSEQHSSTRT